MSERASNRTGRGGGNSRASRRAGDLHSCTTTSMFGYGKTSGHAVAAMSALAECYAEGTQLSSQQIAESRNISQALVGKVLNSLSLAGLVHGARGPGGGYRLARSPWDITVYEVVKLFEGHREASSCPFGPGWCGTEEPCPLHDTLVQIRETSALRLKNVTFGAFAKPD